MRSQIAQRFRSRSRAASLSAVPPPKDSPYYLPDLAKIAKRILYRSPIPSQQGLPIYILNAAAFPDAFEIDYDSLLPYVLERLPREDELLDGRSYEIVFFAGGPSEGATTSKKSRPSWPWFIQAYQVLSRVLRKRIQKLYIVHERTWVRVLTGMFSTIVSPKSARKLVHGKLKDVKFYGRALIFPVSTLSQLALQIPIEDLLIPPSAYLYDRQLASDIHAPYASGRRAFSAVQPFPRNSDGSFRLPRVLRETTSFILMPENVKTEGIFRIPPHAKLKEILREAYDRGQKYIIWKDNRVTLPIPAYPHAIAANALISDVEPGDAYGVYLAAGLMKTWYSELRQPLFPKSSYADVRKLFDATDPPYALETLTELISPHSEFPMLPVASRLILVNHLIPMLVAISAHEEQNKMNADNLAMCFAPALLCGEDPMEDAKMSGILRRILASAVEQWDHGLRDACGILKETFTMMLQSPARIEDYEDPLEDGRVVPGSSAYYDAQQQSSGIILQDNDQAPSIAVAPPLPPRPPVPFKSDHLTTWTDAGPPDAMPRRKPAPQVSVLPPRYSAVIAQDTANLEESPTSYDPSAAAVSDGFAPSTATASAESYDASLQMVVPKRKALTSDTVAEKQLEEKRETRSMSEGHTAIAGILAGQAAEAIRRKPVSSTQESEEASRESGVTPTSPPPIVKRRAVSQAQGIGSGEPNFVKPTWAASANPLTINTLAKPVYPSGGSPGSGVQQDSPNSLPPPSYAPKARTPSPGLRERMPSFEPSKPPLRQDSSDLKIPGKLNLKKPSVDDLRRLYEERSSTAKSIVEATSPRSVTRTGSFSPSSAQSEGFKWS